MRKEYDFSDAVRNPFVKEGEGKQVVTIRLDTKTVQYFKNLGTVTGTPYQTLINSFLAECVQKELKPVTTWK